MTFDPGCLSCPHLSSWTIFMRSSCTSSSRCCSSTLRLLLVTQPNWTKWGHLQSCEPPPRPPVERGALANSPDLPPSCWDLRIFSFSFLRESSLDLSIVLIFCTLDNSEKSGHDIKSGINSTFLDVSQYLRWTSFHQICIFMFYQCA